MKDELDDFKAKWKAAKETLTHKPQSASEIVAQAESRKRSSLYHQYGNIAVLFVVMAMVIVFFYFIFPFGDLLSKAGVGLMVGGLALRIGIEFFSTLKFRSIDLAQTTVKTTEATESYYVFRKNVNGPVSLVIVALYSAGFYMLTPEFSKYFPFWVMVTMDLGYVVICAVLIWQIRKGVLQEMKDLNEIVALKKDISRE